VAGDAAGDGDRPVFDVYDAGGGYDVYDASSSNGSQGAASSAGVLRSVLGGLGEVLITLGVVISLYLVYELWWSNITAAQETQRNSAALLRTWRQPGAARPSDAIADGQSFGFLYIPALGADWRALIMQSVDRTSVLNTGAVGHYTEPASALPWDAAGNFALAGHRDGHGMIFRDLDRLAVGERVYVETRYGWFVYQLDREAASVAVNDVGAVEPVPAGSGYSSPGRYLTLTTCTPIYVDSNRMVWWGHLVEQTPEGRAPDGVTPIASVP
jgi:LPXTG-site transpeptidase (sortase) family protein